ncbi:D-sedoheptulose-7-phosphate isomerase [Synoicihabitans lomoniglobus]|uniref:SIS domain-containing protein n=1 Tax=Synoicihabitans lomoniglobus TaxID=2909285 RepID=A0AAF0I651_9BACT|nr:SIS domain-containing protein [Opitutaceae bacterium LMO-M01]WED67365.1 SIS domain-containing protein [Opitutaceae bacterium LMO-M01]
MISTLLAELIATLEESRRLIPAIEAAGHEIRTALRAKRRIYTAGNGGSAADAMHLAEELIGRFDRERPSLPAIPLCSDSATLTCIANDYGFEKIFSRQIEGLGQSGDILVIFSTSGKSLNIITALQVARDRGLRTIAVLGKDGGPSKLIADHAIVVPSQSTARIQEVHTFILHAWLSLIEGDLELVQ